MLKVVTNMLSAAGTGLGLILFLGLGLFQIVAGWLGLEHAFGWGWAAAAVFFGLFAGFTLPLTVGVFFFVRDVLEWHWVVAVLIAAPGLALMIPGLIADLFSRR